MNFKKLKIELSGPIWWLKEFEVENLNVISKWQNDDETKNLGSVSLENVPCSPDNILDVYVNLVSPNGTPIKLLITGILLTEENKKVKYEKSYTVRNGYLRINVSEEIKNLISNEL